MTEQDWRVVSRRMLCQSKIFGVEQREIDVPAVGTRPGQRVVRDVVLHAGAAVVMPVTRDNQLVMVEQYRFAVGRTLWEFPAGTVEDGEDALACARRELAEEVSQSAEEWQHIGVVLPVPGYCNEQQHLFLARGLEAVQAEPDPDEILSVRSITVEEFETRLKNGTIQDAKTLCAYFLARQKGMI